MQRRATLSLGSPRSDCLIAGNSREKLEPLSLKIPSFLSLSFSLSNSPSQPVWEKRGVKFVGPLTCHMSIFYWLMGLHLIPYPSTLDFHPMASCHVSTHGPHLSSCLTNPTHDTWHLLIYSKCAKCLILPSLPRKT